MTAGPFLAACGLLAIAGIEKLRRPGPARAAAFAAGLRVPSAVVVAFGAAELAAAVAGAASGGWAALAVAVCYVALAAIALRLLVHAPATPCACLGSPDAVVTRAHVALNVAAAVVAVATASSGSPLAQLQGRWVAGGVFLVLVACCVRLAALVLESQPAAAALAASAEEAS